MKVRLLRYATYRCIDKDPLAYCLDIAWITEEMFASCGADGKIHFLRMNQTNPLKTLTYAKRHFHSCYSHSDVFYT